jgi:hypothetical protein
VGALLLEPHPQLSSWVLNSEPLLARQVLHHLSSTPSTLSFFLALGIEPEALYRLGKHCTPDFIYPPLFIF